VKFVQFLLALFLLFPSANANAGKWFSQSVTGLWGTMDYNVYLPTSPTNTFSGLILGLHGCNQSAEDFASITRISALADRQNLVAVFPKQSRLRNADRCWNWFLPINQTRYGTEPSMIMAAVKDVGNRVKLDRNKVFVLGLSSGGIMANVLGSCYPDIFSGVAIHSGIEFAEPAKPRDLIDGHMRCPIVNSWISGSLAYSCAGFIPHTLPKVILFQGDIDQRVYPCNSDSIFKQWITMENLSGVHASSSEAKTQSGRKPDGYSYKLRSLETSSGWQMRQMIIHDLAHAWSGGPPGYFASDSQGPDATEILWNFFTGAK
jgi:poly(hydroxyalkanoate) depolymerase family esterase